MSTTFQLALPTGLQVLIVDGHADTVLTIRSYLTDLGHYSAWARTCAEASVLLPLASWDVVLSELLLQDGTGWELIKRVPMPSAYWVAATGLGREADLNASREAGFHRHLLKPFGTDEIDELLERARAHRKVLADGKSS